MAALGYSDVPHQDRAGTKPRPSASIIIALLNSWRNTEGVSMNVRKFALADASFERSPGEAAEVYAGNVIDQRHGGPITIGFGRYAPNQSIDVKLAVDDVMMVLAGRLSVSSEGNTFTAGPGEIVYMPKGEAVTIRSHEQESITAYVTYPHWQEAED
jgi:ethanolamine utilization protein EutQ (cupin superfamily)